MTKVLDKDARSVVYAVIYDTMNDNTVEGYYRINACDYDRINRLFVNTYANIKKKMIMVLSVTAFSSLEERKFFERFPQLHAVTEDEVLVKK